MCIISELKTKAQMKRMDTYQSNEGGKGLVGFILLLLAKQLQGTDPNI